MDILSIREDFISGKVDLVSFYNDVIKRIEDKKELNIFLDFSKEKVMERVNHDKEAFAGVIYDVKINTNNKTVKEVADEILSLLER